VLTQQLQSGNAQHMGVVMMGLQPACGLCVQPNLSPCSMSVAAVCATLSLL
jgi:hypothetical protein